MAKEEKVECLGTLGLIKSLHDNNLIDNDSYINCLTKLKRIYKERRLPINIIKEMLEVKI